MVISMKRHILMTFKNYYKRLTIDIKFSKFVNLRIDGLIHGQDFDFKL